MNDQPDDGGSVTRYQKAITPSMSDASLRLGYDRVAGFAVPVADVTWATTPADLHAVHALGVDEGGDKRATISSVGHDADAAEAAGMVKVDAGVYEMVVDPDELTDLTPHELVPAAWR
ncbi:hypothetical protein [Sanguibacter massiliensis]|uniref:hypothetical protein n=1 Tax=Sanguibacter massiliensis TaxID=1973217 RepID=UPI000C85F297|nr:hypothetical protein [Sanguibacter massiliensis]